MAVNERTDVDSGVSQFCNERFGSSIDVVDKRVFFAAQRQNASFFVSRDRHIAWIVRFEQSQERAGKVGSRDVNGRVLTSCSLRKQSIHVGTADDRYADRHAWLCRRRLSAELS